MKFRYYITDTFDGIVKGTNDQEKAMQYAACPDFFVVDTETGLQHIEDGDTNDIEEA